MIHPTAEDTLRCVLRAIDDSVLPALEGLPEASTAKTITHLLRHVRVRLEREGQCLFDELNELNALLRELVEYFAVLEAENPAAVELGLLREALQMEECKEARYPSLHDTGNRIAALRERAYSSLRLLQTTRERRGGEPSYLAIRARIRAYIRWQLQQEGQLIQAAFEGFGPRR
jgi:hypothetical protein